MLKHRETFTQPLNGREKKHFKKLHPNFLYIFFSTICPSAVHLHGNVCSNNCDFINQRCY